MILPENRYIPIIPGWAIQAGALTSWIVFSVTRGTGVLTGSGVELLGTAIGSLCSNPVTSFSCRSFANYAKQQIVGTSETTAMIIGGVAGVGVTTTLTVGRLICIESNTILQKLLQERKEQQNGMAVDIDQEEEEEEHQEDDNDEKEFVIVEEDSKQFKECDPK